LSVVRIVVNKRIFLAEGIVSVTGPGIILSPLDDFSPKGVALDVATGLQEVAFGFDGEAVVTALPEMPEEAVLSAHMEPIAPLDLVHEADQFFRCGGAQEQMDMVGHEAIMMEVGIVSGRCFRAELKIERVVLFFPEETRWRLFPRAVTW